MITEKLIAGMLSCLILAMLGGCGKEPETVISAVQPLAVTLGPESSEYILSQIFRSDVQFAVAVENKDENPITFAHPTICFPEDYRIGKFMDYRTRYGKSEILLTVLKPDGSEVILRDGPHFFDPDNVSHFTITPGESKLFYIGWFFQNARGGWENDIKADFVFTERGEYKLKLLYRNFFPKALIHDASAGESRFTDVWTGEIQSNEVTVVMR